MLLVSNNVLDRLAIIHTMKELNLQRRLSTTNSIEEAAEMIFKLYVESQGGQGFAFVIFILELESEFVKSAVKQFKKSIQAKNVPYAPKIVILNSIQNKINQGEEAERMDIDY